VKQTAKAAPPAASHSVVWLSSISARPCQGDGPHGFLAEFPTIPPSWSAPAIAVALPVDYIPLGDEESRSHTSIPPDPPPRRG
jgi:hypothetical protein